MSMRVSPAKVRTGEVGFSLLELMVAMTLSFVALGALTSVYLSSKQSYRLNQALAEIQENARFALEFLKRDLRMAGSFGCFSTDYFSDLAVQVNPGDQGNCDWCVQTDPLKGYEGKSFDHSSKQFSLNSENDAFYVHYAGIEIYRIQSVETNQKTFTVQRDPESSSTASPSKNELFAIVHSGCHHTDIFKPTQVNPLPNDRWEISYSNLSVSYPENSWIYRYNAYAYYIEWRKENSTEACGQDRQRCEPVLMRFDGSQLTTPQEMVRGVEEMQLCYLEGGSWKRADGVSDWKNVAAVRITLVVRSREDLVTPTKQTYKIDLNCDGDTEDSNEKRTAPDQRFRRVYTTIVQLRNS